MTIIPPRGRKTRIELLHEIRGLPSDAFVTPQHAAALLDTTTSVLANWRSQRRGPVYSGHRDFIRYRIEALRQWMMQREREMSILREVSHA